MKKRLVETIEAQVFLSNFSDVMFHSMCSEWTGLPYAELSVLLAQLRALQCIHHTHHWQTMGDSFYGDHQLFARLYEGIAGEIDTIGEKVIGVGCVENVRLDLQVSQTMQFVNESLNLQVTMIPQKNDLVKKSLMCEYDFLRNCKFASEALHDSGLLTRGVDNMLQTFEDVHEGHVYLLKQRAAGVEAPPQSNFNSF